MPAGVAAAFSALPDAPTMLEVAFAAVEATAPAVAAPATAAPVRIPAAAPKIPPEED